MNCIYTQKCGSCTLGHLSYGEQLAHKIELAQELLKYKGEIYESKHSAFRSKAEFKIYKDDEGISYAMRGKSGFVKINDCDIVSSNIKILMPKLLYCVSNSNTLKNSIFEAHFLDGTTPLVTLIYHKKLGDEWLESATNMAKELGISIVGRSKGQKIVIGNDFVDTQVLNYIYRFSENGFSQPNRFINAAMLTWAQSVSKNFGGDLLEAYCGSGNFTIALASNFDKVLATEISTPTIALAKHNAANNKIENIFFARLSGEELSQAINKEREFNRLKGADLDSYNFSTILVDPPRAGLDDASRAFAAKFDNIIYISCSPQTLARDLKELEKTHSVQNVAFFDQFPYTSHLECGVSLKRK